MCIHNMQKTHNSTISKQITPLRNGEKHLKRHLTKEDIEIAVSIWKDAQHHMSLGNCELRQQWDTITYLLE